MIHPTMVDYPGKIAALFFTKGCNFRCGYCHNASLLPASQSAYTWKELDEFCEEYSRQWVEAITISGGEPSLHSDLPKTLKYLRKKGFLLKVDTNGSKPTALEKIIPLTDYLAMDIKCSLAKYPELAGWTDVEVLQESVALIKENAADYEFRTTVLENFHTDEELLACAKLAEGAKRYILQAFLPREDLPAEEYITQQRTSLSFLQHAQKIVAPWVQECIIRGEN